ncbi:MAG: Gfo/Idh/MocA family oxidoreductase [Armatimonadetes bacterium]|nr:Gfo/Idh/MocA family oxidoreductase [Armatimonadota bacterium]
MSTMSRRRFVEAGALAAGVAATGVGRAQGTDDRLRLGFIGVGNRGSQLLAATLPNADVEVIALCDVYEPYLKQQAAKVGGTVATYSDFREVLKRDDIHGVVIATPDHWHAIQTIMACDAGKDVYVEKPLCITIREGRRMVEAARRNQRIVQVGTHRRSSTLLPQLRELIRGGTIGKVTVARCYRISNMFPDGIGRAEDGDPPEGLDWDMWLGPRAERPFNPTIAPYKFRWHSAYSSQVANWGIHYLDAIRWMLDEQAPKSVVALGGRFAVNDRRDIPDTMEAVFELPSGCLLVFGQYEASNNPALRSGEMELRGTLGTVYASERSFEVVPERAGQFGKPEPVAEARTVKASDGDLTALHIRNFLDCMKTRETPNADVEIGHRSTTFSLLANISLAEKARIEWDAVRERILSPESANRHLHYEYRAPWKLG